MPRYGRQRRTLRELSNKDEANKAVRLTDEDAILQKLARLRDTPKG